MQENKDLEKLHALLRGLIYLLLILDFAVLIYGNAPFWGILSNPLQKLSDLPMYQHVLYSKLCILAMICLASIGTTSKKDLELNVRKHIVLPLLLGLFFFFGGIDWYGKPSEVILFSYTTLWDGMYMLSALIGSMLIHASMDNVSKIIRSSLGKDNWNIEGESFMQARKIIRTPYSVNIPTRFYHAKRVHRGFINIVNPFRGTMVIGTPGSGKSYGVIHPFIRQTLAKGFTMVLYDFKFPDLGNIAYYHYLLAKQQGKNRDFKFYVIHLDDPSKSCRINPLRADYIKTLPYAIETAEALVEALKKGDKSGGSDAFFTQSAVNFLACCIYFFARYQKGKYSSLPHVLSFLSHSYEEIFTTLFSNPELKYLLGPFTSAFNSGAFDQLEGMIGTLRVQISRLATKETFWVFSGDDFDLKISNPESPSILVLAGDPDTQSINSACYSVLLNRLTKLINSKGNVPVALIIDEVPTLFVHKIENLIATARSNKVAVVMGLQEIPQFKQQYGKNASDTIISIIGNILAGSVRNKETLDWLERLFGKIKQRGESLSIDRNRTSVSVSERLESLIPAGKISSLRAGEMVGVIAADVSHDFDGKYETAAVHAKINLNTKAILREEASYQPLPTYYTFPGGQQQMLTSNFDRINREVADVVKWNQPKA